MDSRPSFVSPRKLALAGPLALLVVACGAPTPEPQKPTQIREVNVDACAMGDSAAQLKMVDELAAEFKEMPVCGALTNSFAFSFAELLVSIATSRSTSPSGLSYQGGGYYGAGTVMGLQTRLGHDTSFGKTGDELTFDLFDPGQYFKSINLEAQVELGVSLGTEGGLESHTTGSLTLTSIDSPGPALELFGIDPSKLGSIYDVGALAESAGNAVTFGLEVRQGAIKDGKGTAVWLSSPVTKVFDMYSNAPLKWEVVDVRSEKEGQKASLESWDINYQAGHGDGYLDGTIVMRVDGDFTYYVKYEYAKTLDANIYVSCAPPM